MDGVFDVEGLSLLWMVSCCGMVALCGWWS